MKATITIKQPEPIEREVTIVMGENDYNTLIKILGKSGSSVFIGPKTVDINEYQSLISNFWEVGYRQWAKSI